MLQSKSKRIPLCQKKWEPLSFFELQIYTLRHVQEHAAQLSLFLGQHSIPDEALDWVPRAKSAHIEGNVR